MGRKFETKNYANNSAIISRTKILHDYHELIIFDMTVISHGDTEKMELHGVLFSPWCLRDLSASV